MHCGYYLTVAIPVLRKSSAVAFQVVPVISLNEVDMESVPRVGARGRVAGPRCLRARALTRARIGVRARARARARARVSARV